MYLNIKLLQIWEIFTHFKLCVAVARHNLKWVKIQLLIINSRYSKTRKLGGNSSPWIWKGVSATSQSGKYTFS